MAKRSSIHLTLIRCGQTTWDAQGRIHGATDLPLSEAGRAEMNAQAKHLVGVKSAIIHHPPDEAATEAARIWAAPLGAKLRAVPELTDPNLGLLEGLTEQEFAERFRSRHKQWKEDPMTLSPPEGEDVAAGAERILRAVAKVVRRSRGEEVAIVLHQLGAALLRCWVADRPLARLREMEDAPAIERIIVPMSMLDSMEDAAKIAAPAS